MIRIPSLALCLFSGLAFAQETPLLLTVDAGPRDRLGAIVELPAPEELSPGSYRLVGDQAGEAWLQVGQDAIARFVLDRLPAGESRSYRVVALPLPDGEGPFLRGAGRRVEFGAGSEVIAAYHLKPDPLPRADIDSMYTRSGYLHPVRTPSGRTITDDYPPNHIHHHGIWAAWTSTRFQGRAPDFWNMGDGSGTVVVDSLVDRWSGPVDVGLAALHRYVDLSAPGPTTALEEIWTTRVYAPVSLDRTYHVLDVDLYQTTATDSALVLPEYRYGGIGFRGPRAWDGAENTVFLTSEGKTRLDGHATRARWCYVGGQVDGGSAGLAILGHPSNFRAPEPMRIHPTEPFFNYAPSQAGDWSIEPGTPHRARYRFVIFDGDPDPAVLDRLWDDYASPPQVRFQR